MKVKKEERISLDACIFALSFWLIFITIEGSFSIQILLPFLIITMFYNIIIRRDYTLKINKESKILFIFILSLIFSTVVNLFKNTSYIGFDTIIGVLYFIVIFLWYWFNTNKKYNSLEIQMMTNSYIWMSVVCSVFLILRFLKGQTGKIAMINLINVEIDENYVSALIALATMYIFNKILNKKSDFKEKGISICLIMINSLAIALSGSRAALIATIIAMILAFLFSFYKDLNFKKLVKIAMVIIIAICIGRKILDYIPAWTYNRYFNSNYADNSNNTRILLWKNGIDGIFNSPIFGYSIRVFDKLPEYSYINGFKIPARVPAHQTYLDLLLYTGILGFIPFMIFLCMIFKKFLKNKNKIYIPMIFVLIFITNIIGAEKSVFLWNNLILLTIIGDYLLKDESNIDDIL